VATLSSITLRRQRRALGLTQKDLAIAAGVSESAVCAIEARRNRLTPRTEGALLSALERTKSEQASPQAFRAIKVRPLRLRLRLTQSELASRAGLSKRTVYDLERGTDTRPRRSTLDKLREALENAKQEQTLHPVGAQTLARRNAAALTQAELAKLAGVTASSVVRAESGKHRMRTRTLAKITAALDAVEPIPPDNTLVERRKAARLSVADLAKKAKVSARTINHIENGRSVPMARIRRKLHEVLKGATADCDGSLARGGIREKRIAEGMTLKELAKRVGISDVALGNIERGKFKPRPRTLGALERILCARKNPPNGHGKRLFRSINRKARGTKAIVTTQKGNRGDSSKESVPPRGDDDIRMTTASDTTVQHSSKSDIHEPADEKHDTLGNGKPIQAAVSPSAAAKYPGHIRKPHKTGRTSNPKREEVMEHCYDCHVLNGLSRKDTLQSCIDNFGEKRAPRWTDDVWDWCKELSTRYEPALPLARKPPKSA
jgi:transcriptional regulator with XRE-family HTH domain